jgi:hypothetical protein
MKNTSLGRLHSAERSSPWCGGIGIHLLRAKRVKRAVSGRDHSLSGLGDLSDGSWIPDVLVFDFLEADGQSRAKDTGCPRLLPSGLARYGEGTTNGSAHHSSSMEFLI